MKKQREGERDILEHVDHQWYYKPVVQLKPRATVSTLGTCTRPRWQSEIQDMPVIRSASHGLASVAWAENSVLSKKLCHHLAHRLGAAYPCTTRFGRTSSREQTWLNVTDLLPSMLQTLSWEGCITLASSKISTCQWRHPEYKDQHQQAAQLVRSISSPVAKTNRIFPYHGMQWNAWKHCSLLCLNLTTTLQGRSASERLDQGCSVSFMAEQGSVRRRLAAWPFFYFKVFLGMGIICKWRNSEGGGYLPSPGTPPALANYICIAYSKKACRSAAQLINAACLHPWKKTALKDCFGRGVKLVGTWAQMQYPWVWLLSARCSRLAFTGLRFWKILISSQVGNQKSRFTS